MLKVKNYLLVILILVLVCQIGCARKEPPKTATAAGSGQKKEVQAGKAMDDGVEHKVLSFNLEGLTEKGEKKWEVVGKTARSISENEVRLGNIVARTYGSEEAVIVADYGIYDKSKNNVRLEKNVVATIENTGSALKDQLGFSLDGSGNDTAKKDSINGKKEKRKMVITCDGEVEFNYAKNLAYFKDNVKVKSDDGDIDADKITVNLDPTSKKINDIIAEGHVKITQKENVAYGDTARYSEADKTVSLTGKPKIIISQESEGIIKEKFAEK